MAEKSYDEIMRMIKNACNNHFYSGAKNEEKTIIECTTQIYVAQMQTHIPQKEGCR